MTRMASVVFCIRADCPSVQVLHVCVSLWVCVYTEGYELSLFGEGWRERGGGVLNVPVLLWKEEGRPALAIFATTSTPLFPSTAPVDHQPRPSLPKGSWSADGQSSKWQRLRSVHGALCLDYTKLRPHKISRCVAASFRRVVLAWDMASDSLCVTNLYCSMRTI